jgi:hypothetical protein
VDVIEVLLGPSFDRRREEAAKVLSACFKAGSDMTYSYYFFGVQQHQYSAYCFFKAPRA